MDTQRELNNVFVIASREFKEYLKSKRFLLIGAFYAVMALAIIGISVLAFNQAKGMGMADSVKPSMVLTMMDYLNIILVLLAIIIMADTISGEKRDRTIYQLLSKPVERSTVVLGKFAGCVGVVSFFFAASSLIAYALVVLLTGIYPSVGDVMSVVEVVMFMILMFAVYVALGTLISTVTKNPLISILGGIIVWIAFFFSNTIGEIIGSISASSGGMIVLDDTFASYPIYAKAMVWVNPISHDMVGYLLGGGASETVIGLPAWGNILFLAAYVVILLAASIVLFERQDI